MLNSKALQSSKIPEVSKNSTSPHPTPPPKNEEEKPLFLEVLNSLAGGQGGRPALCAENSQEGLWDPSLHSDQPWYSHLQGAMECYL